MLVWISFRIDYDSQNHGVIAKIKSNKRLLQCDRKKKKLFIPVAYPNTCLNSTSRIFFSKKSHTNFS